MQAKLQDPAIHKTSESNRSTSGPSSLYRSEIWRMGLCLVRVVPASVCVKLGRVLAWVYWAMAKRRREIVIQNLLPALQSSERAKKTARAVFQQLALKLIDLWRYEAGLPIENLF